MTTRAMVVLAAVLLSSATAAGWWLQRPAATPPVAPAASPPAAAALPAITVIKSPTCGCCGDWVTHLREQGFAVSTQDADDVSPFKRRAGITPALASCHTAFAGAYVIEGHVPAADIRRLLAEQPDALGLAVPGMPMGSPGMEGPRSDPYDVLLLLKDGSTRVFARHGP